jgi:hypothetical protein
VVNGGGRDLLVRIGFMLGNGKTQFPADLRVECRDAGGRKFVLSAKPSFVAGRVDPMLVPLPAGAAYALSLDLRKMTVEEPREATSLPAGKYRVGAVLAGIEDPKALYGCDLEAGLGNGETVELLLGLLRRFRDRKESSPLIGALGRLGDRRAVPVLMEFLDADPRRHDSLLALARLGCDAVRPEAVAGRNIEALGYIGQFDSRVQEVLEQEAFGWTASRHHRWMAQAALGRMGALRGPADAGFLLLLLGELTLFALHITFFY